MASLSFTSLPTSATSPLLAKHVDEIKKYSGLNREEVIVCRRDAVQCKFANGPYRRLGVNLYISSDNYPKSGIVVEVSSSTVAPGVLKKIQSQCEQKVANFARAEEANITNPNAAGDNILLEILLHIQTIVKENKLLCCIHEIRKRKKSLGGHCKDLAMNEKTGVVRMRFAFQNYSATLQINVPDKYPSQVPDIKITKATFPKKVVRIYTMQAREIMRKCSLGYTAEQAMMASRPEKVPPKRKEKEIVITNDLTKQLKNDIKFLKKVSKIVSRTLT